MKSATRSMSAAALVMASMMATAAWSQQCLTEATPEIYATGTSNTALDAADVNGDGALDLISGCIADGSVYVSLNQGDGTFASGIAYSMITSGSLYGAAAGDIDGDGLSDVVAVGFGGSQIRYRLSTGGALGGINTVPAANNPFSAILRDIDADGHVDLLVTTSSPNGVMVYRNDGLGGFLAGQHHLAQAAFVGIAVGDLSGDGLPDVVTTGDGWISVLVNEGGGQFAPYVSYAAPSPPIPRYVVLADLDGDRDLDVATANYYHIGTTSVTLYFNNGDGTLGGRTDYTSGFDAPVGIAAGDFDGDGDVDLAVGNSFSSRIDLMLNNGAGVFPTRHAIGVSSAGAGHYMLVSGDFSGLGRAEIAAARFAATATTGLTVWRGNCDGTDPISVFTCPSGAASFDVRPLEPGATYQWEWMGQTGEWTTLVDGVLTRDDGSVMVTGATTPRLGLILSLNAGAPGGSYRCVMTDAAGTLVSAPGLLSTTLACPTLQDASDRAIPTVFGQHGAVPGSTAVYSFAGLVIDEDGYFELGSGEILNLSNGRGTLFIMPGAVFSANGVVYGHIFNQGLLRLQITPTRWIGLVQGGVVSLPPAELPSPVDPIVEITPEEPPAIPPETMVVVGPGGSGSAPGGGGGGGVGSGSFAGAGGTYRVDAPSFSQGGHLSFDATLEVTGSFTQTDTGVLRMFIAGDQPGETFNQFVVGESAVIDGTIQIVLDPAMFGFTPSAGESFDMVIADGGITLAPGLEFRSMITAEGAALMGLTLPAYASPFLMDPDQLMEFPASLFDVALVNDGKTLRFTMNQAVCSAQPLATTEPACGRDTAEFTVANPGSGPLAYQWQIEDAPGSETWTDLLSGLYEGLGTVLTPTERTLGIRKPRFFASGTRMRCMVNGPCATVTTEPVALSVLDQTEEACGGCAICEADFDDNGGVDGGDLSAFFSAFEEGVLCADIDRNGGVDGGDLAMFFQLFEEGGC